MSLAAVHVAPGWTLVAGAMVGVLLVIHWHRLGADDVLPARRRVRRWTIVLGMLLLLLLVRGMSFLDPDLRPLDYVLTWSMALLLAVGMLLTAGLDALITVHRLRTKAERDMIDGARRLADALRREDGSPCDE